MTTHDQGWVVVTGAGAGIGRAISGSFVAEGYRVLGLDRDAGVLDDTAQSLGTNFKSTLIDVGSAGDVQDALGALDGPVSVVVNNAAIVRARSFQDTTQQDWNDVLGVNLIGRVNTVQAALPRFAETGGRIVNLSSHSADRGSFGRAAYAASKGAVNALTRVLAVELAERGITVNAVAPGPVETPHSKATHTDERRATWASRLPVGRYAESSEIVAAVRFLASPEASFVTGQVLAVDGGFTIAGLTNTI